MLKPVSRRDDGAVRRAARPRRREAQMRRAIAAILGVLTLGVTPCLAREQQAGTKPLQRQESAGVRAPAARAARTPVRSRPAAAAPAPRVAADRAFQLAMETARSNQANTWKDPQTGAAGVISPVRTYQAYDESVCKGKSPCYCREYDASTTVRGRTDLVHGTACRVGEGVWEIVGAN